jgi:hypothetical protein
MRDLKSTLTIQQSTASQAVSSGNTTTNGSAVNIAGYEGIAGLMRISARTDGTYTPKFQVSPDSGSNWYDLDAAGYAGGAAPGAANAVGDTLFGIAQLVSAALVTAGKDPSLINQVRVAVTQAGGTTGATFQTDVILGFPRHSGNAV